MRFQKIILFLFFLFFAQLSFGQTAAGRIQAGGGLSGRFVVADTITHFRFNPSINFGHFITNNVVLQGGLGYSWEKRAVGNSINTTDGFWLTLGFRYYWSGEDIQPFLGLKLSNSLTTINSTNLLTGVFSRIPAIFISPIIDGGVAFFLNKDVALELSFPIRSYSYTLVFPNDIGFESRGRLSNINLSTRLGLQVYLR